MHQDFFALHKSRFLCPPNYTHIKDFPAELLRDISQQRI